MKIDDARKARVAKVHIARKDLCLDDGTYRAVLARVTGRQSCSALTLQQLDQVLEEFRRQGWQPDTKRSMRQGKTATGRMMRGLWRDVSRERSETSLRAMIRRVLGLADNVEPDPDLLSVADTRKVVEAIKAMKRSAGGKRGAAA